MKTLAIHGALKAPRPTTLIFTAVLMLAANLSACAASHTRSDAWAGMSPDVAVQKRIALDDRLVDTEIVAGFKNGTATLTGEVNNLGQKIIAGEDLYEVAGVRQVDNQLTVRPSDIPDEEIARGILGAFPTHCFSETEGIQVKVDHGNVTLTGRSKKLHHKDVIANIAMFTKGVRSIDNRIQVVPDLGGGQGTDARIKENVEGVIGSLRPPARDVSIQVDHGKVTLGGDVHTRSDRRNLERAVRNVPGVVEVNDKITVNGGFAAVKPSMLFYYY